MSDTNSGAAAGGADGEAAARLGAVHQKLRAEIAKVVVGQDRVVDELLTAVFARGHCLLVGVPGLAKTLLISTLSRTLSLSFRRIQFTPDLMPADITGTEVIQEDRTSGARSFQFVKGPVFANVVLADEINRAPPKTQAALLEAMQEHQVSAGGKRYPLDEPFFVLATQNPIEQEGTYPLPEAQLDRFMFHVKVDYPTADEELKIVQQTTGAVDQAVATVLTQAEILAVQDMVRRVPVANSVSEYAIRLVRATRVTKPEAPDFVKEWIRWGAGPRAAICLVIGAKAHALVHGRTYVSTDDVKAVAHPVLRHRVLTNFQAEAEGVTPDIVIDRLLATIPAHDRGALTAAGVPNVLGA